MTSAGTPGGAFVQVGLQCSAGTLLRGRLAVFFLLQDNRLKKNEVQCVALSAGSLGK
jgi:hypothetical protein